MHTIISQSFFQFNLSNSLYTKKVYLHEIGNGEMGVFADTAIVAGEIIGVQGGKILSKKEYLALSHDLQKYPLQISDTYFLGATDRTQFDVIEYLNHSCDPNVGITGLNVFVAMCDIRPDEELRYDYAMSDTTDVDTGGWECGCGSVMCRKKITPNDWRLPELQERYGKFFSQYILEKMMHPLH